MNRARLTLGPEHPQTRASPERGHGQTRRGRKQSFGYNHGVLTIRIGPVRRRDLDVILGLINGAQGRLASEGTDQWSRPWPDTASWEARLWRGLKSGAPWIVRAGDAPAATVTIADRPNLKVWEGTECDASDPAAYVHRLITARESAGRGLGTEPIAWAGRRGRDDYGANWITIDVWSTNRALHGYYTKTGLSPCGRSSDPGCLSGALFQKPVSDIRLPSAPLFLGLPVTLPIPRKLTTEGARPSPQAARRRMGRSAPGGGTRWKTLSSSATWHAGHRASFRRP
jgi:GNAT superfamily N-acetyltransferase